MHYNILICGVGGQGTLLASRVLGAYAAKQNLDCKLSEVHGMAQRGGSVVTYVKFGDKVYSPLIAEGDADVVLAFEQLEAYRWSYCLKQGGLLIMNTQKIMPLPVIVGSAAYPENISQTLQASGTFRVEVLDALSQATAAGTSKAVNTVMLGRLTKCMQLDYSLMRQALSDNVPAKVLEMNQKAFDLGYNGK